MNSLQILSILTLDKVDELKRVLCPKRYYSLLYQSVDFEYIKFNSRNLFETQEQLAKYFLYLMDNLLVKTGQEKYPTCECLQVYLGNDETWTSEQVLSHFLSEKHFMFTDFSYKIVEYQVITLDF